MICYLTSYLSDSAFFLIAFSLVFFSLFLFFFNQDQMWTSKLRYSLKIFEKSHYFVIAGEEYLGTYCCK